MSVTSTHVFYIPISYISLKLLFLYLLLAAYLYTLSMTLLFLLRYNQALAAENYLPLAQHPLNVWNTYVTCEKA